MTVLASTSNIVFARPEAWSFLLQFCIIGIAILLGNIIRRKVKFMAKSLIPSALIGGLVILILKIFPFAHNLIDKYFMELVTYHTLALGFICMALRSVENKGKSTTGKIIESGALTAGTYIIQGIVGVSITIVLYLLFMKCGIGHEIFFASGMLLPMGYGQGPGQALNIGTIYQTAALENFLIDFKSIDFGLSIAAIGFIVGSVIGVLFMNRLRKQGKLSIVATHQEEVYSLDDYEQRNEIPHSESVDKLTIVFSIVLLTYFFVYLLMKLLCGIDMGNFGENTIKPLIYGFNFLWGIMFATLVKLVINWLRKHNFMRRNYLNNFLLNRLSGFLFDVMIVAGTAAIDFENLKQFIVPLVIVCTLGVIATFYYVLAVSKHIYKGYEYQGFLAMFGMLTGTASNGMILLREVDPKYETPAANNLAFQTIPALAMGFPILLLVGYAPKSLTASLISLVILILMGIVFTLFLFRKKVFKKKNKDNN